jgi:putative ABC transport system substrate-binding protein
MQMLLSLTPRPTRVALLINPLGPNHVRAVKDLQAAGQQFGVRVQIVEARSPQDTAPAFTAMARERADALFMPMDGLFIPQRRQVADLAARYKLPSASTDGEYEKEGGLLSYGTDQQAVFRQVATYVDKVLKGARPADLPVEQPTKLDLIVNRKTATALGRTIPQALLISASEVID